MPALVTNALTSTIGAAHAMATRRRTHPAGAISTTKAMFTNTTCNTTCTIVAAVLGAQGVVAGGTDPALRAKTLAIITNAMATDHANARAQCTFVTNIRMYARTCPI